jgi:hypothetical protein
MGSYRSLNHQKRGGGGETGHSRLESRGKEKDASGMRMAPVEWRLADEKHRLASQLEKAEMDLDSKVIDLKDEIGKL